MSLNLFPRSLIKFLMTCTWNYTLIPRPSLHQKVLLNSFFPKRIILGNQPKPTFWLSNDVISINCTTKCTSRPIVSHHVNIGCHQRLVKRRTITACCIKTTLTRSEHIHVKMKVAKEVIACGANSHRCAWHWWGHLALIRVNIVYFWANCFVEIGWILIRKPTFANLTICLNVITVVSILRNPSEFKCVVVVCSSHTSSFFGIKCRISIK